MKQHEVDKLVGVIRSMAETSAPGRPSNVTPPAPASFGPNVESGARGDGRKFTSEETEKLYQLFKARFIDDAKLDPVLLHLIASRPEIVVDIEPKVVELTTSTLLGRLARMVGAGYFKEPRKTGTVRNELARTGKDPGSGGTLGEMLGNLRNDGFLVKEGDTWVAAPGIKVTERTVEK